VADPSLKQFIRESFDRFYEDMVRKRENDPKTFDKIMRHTRRSITRKEGRKAAEEHMRYVERQLKAAERRLAAGLQSPADPDRLGERIAARQEALEDGVGLDDF
jgi:hypothetical protein